MASKQCVSCPFLETNFKEFNAVATKLSIKEGQPKPDFFQCLTIRQRVVDDALSTGRLLCHSTVYDDAMNAVGDGKPCAGLSKCLAETKKKKK